MPPTPSMLLPVRLPRHLTLSAAPVDQLLADYKTKKEIRDFLMSIDISKNIQVVNAADERLTVDTGGLLASACEMYDQASNEEPVDAIECLKNPQSWLEDASPWLKQACTEFVKQECIMTGSPEELLVMPGGGNNLILGLNYAPLNKTAFQTHGDTADPSEPCSECLQQSSASR